MFSTMIDFRRRFVRGAGRGAVLAGAVAVLMLLSACGDISDDLVPSDTDRRTSVSTGAVGNRPGELMADFTLPTTDGVDFTFSDFTEGGPQASDAVVFYFTMWCPICTGHSDRMLFDIMPLFEGRGAVVWVLVDYVSGTVDVSARAQRDSGFTGTPFIVAVDEELALLDQLNASMSSTIVTDGAGQILLNEDFKDGQALIDVLDAILPPGL